MGTANYDPVIRYVYRPVHPHFTSLSSSVSRRWNGSIVYKLVISGYSCYQQFWHYGKTDNFGHRLTMIMAYQT